MKIQNYLAISLLVCATCGIISTANAEDNIFGGLNSAPPAEAPTVKVEQPVQVRGTTQMTEQESLTTQSLQNTISSLESAQTDLKTKLETAQVNYNTANQEYERVKKERAALKKIVNRTKSRIKTLERSKNNVKKAIDAAN